MSAVQTELDQAIEQYALYSGDSLTLKLHRQWRAIEALLGRFIDVKRTWHLVDVEWGACAVSATMCLELANRSNAAADDLIGIRESLPAADALPIAVRPAARALTAMIKTAWRQFSESSEQRDKRFGKPTDTDQGSDEEWTAENLAQVEELTAFQFELFSRRHEILEPVIATIKARRSTRQSRSRYTGGRRRDAGVCPLLCAAAAAGLPLLALAELLVGKDLDRKQMGTRAKRIAREAKRLAEAKRSMDKRANSTPKAVRSVGRKPS